MENPAIKAEAMADAYRNHFIGSGGRAARSVASRISRDGIDDELVGMRGPYLQALDVPNWSDQSWTEFSNEAGLDPLLQFAFEEIGFRRLYDFQERSIRTVLDGDDTVITAATGRGKTEAWLIPILNHILEANRGRVDGVDEDSVKATLIYPTKALAQDQLKRLIEYLYQINSKLPVGDRITVGIYDGDTPQSKADNAQGYLESAFKYFECPGRNNDLEKCQNCDQGVRVRHRNQRYELTPEKRQCIDDVPVDFVRLTKSAILNEGVDILLTNPDTINLKLINTNASDEHESFIFEPSFLVFDEVHTYDGLFGSYTAALTKRIRALREQRGADDLQVIASSATVKNSREMFRKVSGAETIAHVAEQPRTIHAQGATNVPETLLDSTLKERDIVAAALGQPSAPDVLSEFEADIEAPSEIENGRLVELISDDLFDYLTTSGTGDPVVETVRELYTLLKGDPQTKEEFEAVIGDEFDLNEGEAAVLLGNFQTLGEYSGLLENRSHIFSWPLDGFYACVQCDAVYRSPRDECTQCDSRFITRSTYCRYDDEEALVAWYCPSCAQLEPYMPTEEGNARKDDERYCQRCETAREETVRMQRVTFYSTLECQECGAVRDRSIVASCSTCGAEMVPTEEGTAACTNPVCERTVAYDNGCPSCGSTARTVVTTNGAIDCPDCGEQHPSPDPAKTPVCVCGHTLSSTRFLPWVCENGGCDRQYFQRTPPEQCGCGTTEPFVRRGFFEVFAEHQCDNCGASVLEGAECDCDEPDIKPQARTPQSYRTVDEHGEVRLISNVTAAAPCHHRGAGYKLGARFDELVRSPNNIAVTSAQYLLRRVADEEGYENAKMLSFADSHRDMKELDRDFNEPEVVTLFDQLVLAGIEHGETVWKWEDDGPDQSLRADWTPFATVLEQATGRIEEIDNDLTPPNDIQNVEFDLQEHLVDQARRHMKPSEAIVDRLRRRALSHQYSQRYFDPDGPLVEAGLIDVRLRPTLFERLSRAQREIVSQVVDIGNSCPISNLTTPDSQTSVGAVVDDLVEQEVLMVDDEFISFADPALEVTIAGHGDNLKYAPQSRTVYSTLESQFGQVPRDAVAHQTSFTERTDPSHPRFSDRAYRLQYASPRILVSQVYHGLTDKQHRRELEYLFREENYPHFLSSGPTMELGVDIGALDALLLFGTPPNMNAYLQRVGRAGRRSNSALIHSISQRNPIDYYYYEKPTELINAEPKPVPLNEHNEEVLRVSLAWAVFDFIAANFVVPWDVEYEGPYGTVIGGDEFSERNDMTDDGEYAKLTNLMWNDSIRVKDLGLDGEASRLTALRTIVHDYEREARDHLRSLLSYAYCADCSRKYDHESPPGRCENEDCDGEVINALTEYGHLVDEAVDEFETRFIDHYQEYTGQLESEKERLQSQHTELKRKRRRARTKEETRPIQKRMAGIGERIEALEDQLTTVQSQPYIDFLNESPQSKFAFNMRSVSNSVGLTLVNQSDDGEYQRRQLGDGFGGRSIEMALRELHPGAAYLDDGEPYIVTKIDTDEYASTELRQTVSGAGNDELAEELICPSCHRQYSLEADDCPCDADVNLKRRRLVVPERTEAYRADVVTTQNGHKAAEIQTEPDKELQKTFAERDTTVLSFDPVEEYDITATTGDPVGTLTYGRYTVLIHSESYRASYKDGDVDAQKQLFEVCGEEDCNGVVYRDDEGVAQCSADAEHSPNRRDASSEFVRLGYAYDTHGVRVSLNTTEASHAMAHGLRVALQSLGGVSIRDIEEVVAEDHVDVLDADEGGADITRLLIESAIDTTDNRELFENFQHAVEIVDEQFDCDCEDGCPVCLYQYGCDMYNRPQTLDRAQVVELVDGNLTLTDREQPVDQTTDD